MLPQLGLSHALARVHINSCCGSVPTAVKLVHMECSQVSILHLR